MTKKKYKALMLDLDGTTIPNEVNGMPSEKVKKAIALASKKLFVGCVTARPYSWAKEIINSVSFTAPCVLAGGAQILDPVSLKLIWEKKIPAGTANEICILLKQKKVPFLYPKRVFSIKASYRISIPASGQIEIAVPNISLEKADALIEDLQTYKNISVHKVIGAGGKDYWLQITHGEATKQYGILKVAEILGIETHEIIGVGDSYNDFPLLMACGLKVAMGNAAPELKEIADYIAPTVDEDGVADVIEKFVL
jgi:HAD superfamily hydrolase (TIGR01484 family)